VEAASAIKCGFFHQLDRFGLSGLTRADERIRGDAGDVAVPRGRAIGCTGEQRLDPYGEFNVICFDEALRPVGQDGEAALRACALDDCGWVG